MLIYQQKLLGGGWKTFTIESVLDKNFKIAEKFAGTSLIASKQTKNFFELWFKNLNLSSRVHLWVMVTSKPVQLLNLAKWNDALNQKKEDTTAQILEKTFAEYWINYKRKNALYPNAAEQKWEIMKDAEMDTLSAAQKATYTSLYNMNTIGYSNYYQSNIRTQYYNSFNNDLLTLQSFTTKLQEHIVNIIGLINSMYAKK
jgi:hypothetical protein